MTRDRNIVISGDKSRLLTQEPAPSLSAYFDRVTSGLAGSDEGFNDRGLREVFSYVPLRTVPWVLVAKLPVEEAYAPIVLAQRRIAGVTLVLGLVLAPVIWLGTRRLLRPLLALRDTIRRIRTDPRSTEEVTVGRLDEIGDLANDFNALMRERRQAESALRASEADSRAILEQRMRARTAELAVANVQVARNERLFRTTIESAPTAMVMIDARGAIVLVNAQTEKLFGYARAELLGQPVEILIPKRFQDAHPGWRGGFFAAPRVRQMGAGRDLYGVHKDGSEIAVEIGLSPVDTEEGPLVLSAIADIIGNGLKYRGTDPPRVHVSAERKDNEWTFAVRDNGIGIAPRHHARIFEIFNRLHDRREYPGSGIGLAVCRRVVHRHGGTIWVESEPGRGSVFFFTIPKGTVNAS